MHLVLVGKKYGGKQKDVAIFSYYSLAGHKTTHVWLGLDWGFLLACCAGFMFGSKSTKNYYIDQ